MSVVTNLIYFAIVVLFVYKMGKAKKDKDIYELLYYGFGLVAINVLYLAEPWF